MKSPSKNNRPCLSLLAILVCFSAAPAAHAQVVEIVVGVTPTCPYGLHACWGGAREGLSHLQGVQSVAEEPNGTEYTAVVRLAKEQLPDLTKWAEQFKAVVGEIHLFRGVEVTVDATVAERDGHLILQIPGSLHPLALKPLEKAIQWDLKTASPREPEQKERDAFQDLSKQLQQARPAVLRARVTGPLKQTEAGFVMEVRQFVPSQPRSPATTPASRPAD